MRRVLIALLIFSPLGAMLYLRLVPGADTVSAEPLFHFYIVTFTTFAAAVISILLSLALGENAAQRHLLAAVAFAAIGSIFFSHGFATPGALTTALHPAVEWSAWLTLMVGGAIFGLASLEGSGGFPKGITIRRILWGTVIFILTYFAVAIFAHDWLDTVGQRADPWHKVTIFAITLAFWLFASVRFAWRWRAERNPVDGTLAFVAFWQGLASISMHNFPLWNASWWMYHYILLLGFLITIFVLVREYEHARQFNLLRYYLAISLIFTALLALIASDLFVRSAFETLAAGLEAHARARIGEFTTGVTNTINPGTAGGDALAIHVDALRTIPALAVLVFDDKAHLVYPLTGDYGAAPAFSEEESDEFSRQETGAAQEVPVPPGSTDGYEAALAGETLIAIRKPGDAPEGYAPAESVHTLETFAPLYAVSEENVPPEENVLPEEVRLPIGVVQLVEEAPELTRASLRARVSSLGITTLTMTVLFTALLLVVRRADRILTTRTNQLNEAFNDLRTSEGLRDDLTKMIVHDLRNPLSAISASVDLLKMTSADGQTEQQAQFTNMAKEATRRMSGLVDDILTVSRYEAGELTLELREASLPDLIERHIAGFGPQADAEEKSITVRCPPDLRARIDTALFGRVIENLVSNALKYVPSGAGKIEVIASPNERRVSFHVLDNGEGIPDEYKSQIFQKYVQVPDERRAVRKGTGLGLAFCRMVIESHGGRIWVQDAPGGGSDFVFWVPV